MDFKWDFCFGNYAIECRVDYVNVLVEIEEHELVFYVGVALVIGTGGGEVILDTF